MSQKPTPAVTKLVRLAVAVFLITISLSVIAAPAQASDPALPDGLTAEQEANAEAIASVAQARNLGTPGVLVGEVTAYTESTLINVGHGDALGADSIGLFQQMPGWGPLSVRTDPKGAAGLFYDAVVKIPNWQSLTAPDVAQRVEQSEYDGVYHEPYCTGPDNLCEYAANYTSNMAVAQKITDYVLGQPGASSGGGGGISTCPTTGTGTAAVNGTGAPAKAPVTTGTGSSAITQNDSQDPTSFGWTHPPKTSPLTFQGHEIYGGVATGTEGLWTGLLTDLTPVIPGGIQDLGGFEDRANVNNPSKLSFHAYGLALDINASENPNGVDPSSLSGQYVIPPAAAEAAAKKWGMEWGGEWNDAMHFEIHLTPADALTLAQQNGVSSGGGSTPTAPCTVTVPGGTGATGTVTTQCGAGTVQTADATDAQSFIGAISAVVGQFAITSLCWTLQHVDIGTSPQLNSTDPNNWYQKEYIMFKSLALWIIAPILMMATIHAVLKGSLHLLLKTFLVYLPVAIIGGAIAVAITQLLLDMTDDFAQTFIGSIESNAVRFFGGVSDGFGIQGVKAGIPWFATILLGLMLGFACIGVYIILVLREASVYIAASFLPISLAFFIWPSTAHFFKKMFEFLIAMIFSKLVMVAGISLAVAAMASTTGLDAANESLAANGSDVGVSQVTAGSVGSGTESWFTWLGQTMSTTVMMSMVFFAPNMTVKLLASSGLTNMGRQVSEHHSRPKVMAKAVFVDRVGGTISKFNEGRAAIKAMPAAREAAAMTTQQDRALGLNGVKRGADGTYALTVDDLQTRNITDAQHINELRQLSMSEDPNNIMASRVGAALEDRYDGYEVKDGHTVVYGTDANGNRNEAIIVADVVNRANNRQVLNWVEPALVRRAAEDQLNSGINNVRVLVPYDMVNQGQSHADGHFVAGHQQKNAALITRELQELQSRHRGSNVHLIADSTATAHDMVYGSANPVAGGTLSDYV